MRKIIFVVTILFLQINCAHKEKLESNKLRKITDSELINIYKNHDFPDFENIPVKDNNGVLLSQDSLESVRQRSKDFFPDLYLNTSGEIVEMIFRKTSEKDKLLIERIREAVEEGPDLKVVDIDCANKSNILQGVYNSDQNVRKQESAARKSTDLKNIAIVVSMLEKCGLPSSNEVSEDQLNAIWLAIQHADKKYRKRYFPLFEEASKEGSFDKSNIAMMQDRILMDYGNPQIYGTQVFKNDNSGNWELYHLADPITVDERRGSVGLGPIKN